MNQNSNNNNSKSFADILNDFISKPSPVLIFIFSMFILNIDFWLILFTKASLKQKLTTIKLFKSVFVFKEFFVSKVLIAASITIGLPTYYTTLTDNSRIYF